MHILSRLVGCSLLLLAGNEASSAAAPAWKVGISVVDITPDKPIWMAGFAARKSLSTGVSHRLYAKAIALDDGSKHPAVLVTTDLLGINAKVSASLAKQVQQRYRIPRERLLLNSSHTHCGPILGDTLSVAYDLSPQHWQDSEEYTAQLESKVVAAVGQALQNRRPARLRFGHSQVDFAANRRLQINPNGPVDHDVPVLRADSLDGKLQAVLFGYACHNTTISAEHCLLNGDYAGYAQSWLQEHHPQATAFFLSGCGGDANPKPRGTVELARQHGNSLAVSVDQVLGSLQPVSGPLTTVFGYAALPFATPPTQAELTQRLTDSNEYVRRHARLLLRVLAREGKLATEYPDPVQVWRFGSDLTLIALGGEVVVDYALRLKQQYGADKLWVAGYSNDVFGYVPSQRVLREGGYEGGGAMMYYGQTGPFADSVEEVIFQKIEELMKTAQQPAKK